MMNPLNFTSIIIIIQFIDLMPKAIIKTQYFIQNLISHLINFFIFIAVY